MKGTKRCCFRQKDKSHLFNPLLHKNHVAISFPLTSNNKRDNILFFLVWKSKGIIIEFLYHLYLFHYLTQFGVKD